MPAMTSRITQRGIALLARRGLALQRHPAVRRQAMLALHRVDLVLDVGAARGGFAEEIREFGYTGRIVSFEPLQAAYRDLDRAAAGDPSWVTVNAALGSAPDVLRINVASNSDSSSLLPFTDAHTSAAPQVDYVAEEDVRVERLDDIAPDLVPATARPFLKIDTQGFEREVLAGGGDTLARCVGLQLELSLTSLYEGGMLIDEAIATAYDAGFELTSLSQGFTSPDGRMLQADGVFFRP